MFKITANKGFHIQFANGNTVSVQFGGGNYCENSHKFEEGFEEGQAQSCENAEVWAWDKDGNPFCEVQGWQSPDEVAAFIAKYSA
jgi:hypothetical protein